MPIPELPAATPLSWYLLLSAVLFALGVAGFLFRKNIITVFMSIELMLNAVNLTFVAFAYQFRFDLMKVGPAVARMVGHLLQARVG